jgi:GT2 family glycosyltransferase
MFVIVILHYSEIKYTAACLESVVSQCHSILSILLVNNGSADDLSVFQLKYGSQINFLNLSDNRGWAGGNNAGIAWARDRHATAVCLLNNDTVVPCGVLDRLMAKALECGPCLMHPAIDFADPTEGVQLDPSVLPDAVHFNYQSADGAPVFILDFAYGACLTVPMAVFDQIGTFDERFFLQLEETDFYYRAKRNGIPALCLPSVRIVHAESRSFGGRNTPNKTYYITRNRLLLAEKSRPRWQACRAALRLILWRADELANGKVFPWIISAHPQAKAMRQGLLDYCLRRFGQRRTQP